MRTGFLHDNRGVGIRHHQLVLPSVVCSTHVARRIANQASALTFAHQHGCGIIGEDVAGIDDFFASLAAHPNVSSVLVVGLGCETIQAQELSAKLFAVNTSTKFQIIQESGGVESTVLAGVRAAQELDLQFPKQETELNRFTVGLDFPEENELLNTLVSAIGDAGLDLTVAKHTSASIDSFAELMQAKSHVIISRPLGNQPASGFPLIPVINISSNSALHLATAQDFDLGPDADVSLILQLLFETVTGSLTKSEVNKMGEIRAPRLVRSV